jgi:hypothetical protein
MAMAPRSSLTRRAPAHRHHVVAGPAAEEVRPPLHHLAAVLQHLLAVTGRFDRAIFPRAPMPERRQTAATRGEVRRTTSPRERRNLTAAGRPARCPDLRERRPDRTTGSAHMSSGGPRQPDKDQSSPLVQLRSAKNLLWRAARTLRCNSGGRAYSASLRASLRA